jgi:hypothetical protein
MSLFCESGRGCEGFLALVWSVVIVMCVSIKAFWQ